MTLLLNAVFFAYLGYLVGAQLHRFLSSQASSKYSTFSNTPLRYWLSYILTLAVMFLVIFLGAKNGVFDKHQYGVVWDIISFGLAGLFCYFGYRFTKWRSRDKAI